jgi:hypothetical protein
VVGGDDRLSNLTRLLGTCVEGRRVVVAPLHVVRWAEGGKWVSADSVMIHGIEFVRLLLHG